MNGSPLRIHSTASTGSAAFRGAVSERQCQRLTNPIAVGHRAIRELPQGRRCVDFGLAEQQASAQAGFVGGLPLTMTRALGILA